MIAYFADIDRSRSAGVMKGDSFRVNMHNEAITNPNFLLNYHILSDEFKDAMRNKRLQNVVLVP